MTTIIQNQEFINMEDGKFRCSCCGSIISNKQSLKRHLDTKKHLNSSLEVKEEVKEDVKEDTKIDFSKFTITELMFDINQFMLKDGKTCSRKKLPKSTCLKIIETYNITKHYFKKERDEINEKELVKFNNLRLIHKYQLATKTNVCKLEEIVNDTETIENIINRHNIRDYDFTPYNDEIRARKKIIIEEGLIENYRVELEDGEISDKEGNEEEED